MNTDTPETDAVWADIPFFDPKLPTHARNLERQRNNTLALLEREQMRLAACDVIAMCDTPASAAEARQMHSDHESAALDSVKRRVDECIALRQMVRELRDATEAVLPYIEGDKIAPWRPARNAITKANQLLP